MARVIQSESGAAADAEPAPVVDFSDLANIPGNKVVVRPEAKDRSFAWVMGSTAAAVLLAFAIGRSGAFTPGDNIGYYTGLVGGVLMLLLLLYPLRKHVSAFRNWGAVKHWFAVHMVLGIGGPVLVLAHSTFHMRSTNAAVALICMLVVAASGIVGRFLYTKVHRGLYGEKLNLHEIHHETQSDSSDIRSRLHFAPAVEARLLAFEKLALGRPGNLFVDALRLFTVVLEGERAYHACARELGKVLKATGAARGWDAGKLRRRTGAARNLVRAHILATKRVAQFITYDRLLKLWHVAHVPLVYLLVISSIAHVVAVHMY